MRNRLFVLAALAIGLVAVAPRVARAVQVVNASCYFDQGALAFHIGSGCTETVESGGTLNVIGTLKFNGTAQKILAGQATTATASDTVVTGLAAVTSCVATLDAGPVADPEVATCSIGNQTGAPAAGSVLIQTWKTLGSTPVAATTFSKKVNWLAYGH